VDDFIDISWKALDTNGKMKIWVSLTNNFKQGKSDKYLLMGEVPVHKERILINSSNIKSSFFKVVAEGPYNSLNKWFSK